MNRNSIVVLLVGVVLGTAGYYVVDQGVVRSRPAAEDSTERVTESEPIAGKVILKKVGYITVLVSDVDRAAEFYQNTLGIAVRPRVPGVSDWVELELDTEGTALGLFSPGERWPEGKKFIGGHTGIYLETQDFEEVYGALSSKGVRFAGPPIKWGSDGMEVTFLDLDGNEIVLFDRRVPNAD